MKYDDSDSGGFSYLEKIALVAKGQMNPHEIGMTSQDDAIREITGKKLEKPQPFLGDWVTFEASVIPLDVLAKWARKDLKVIPTDTAQWEADWKEQHKAEFRVQGILKSGSVGAVVDQKYTDPILGFCEMLRQAADMLTERYEQIKNETDKPIKTRDDLRAEAEAKSQGL
jgi:hypothetical protein